MSKSVIVIDTPEKCINCPLCVINCEHECLMCSIHDKNEFVNLEHFGFTKPDWCPLLPLPKRKNIHEDVAPYNLYHQGYNDCLYDIQKEKVYE